MSSLVQLGATIGSIYLGVVLSSIIYGVSIFQVYLYYTRYCCRDGIALKSFVGLVMGLDTLHVALVVLAGYHYAVMDFGNYASLLGPYWSLIWEELIGGTMTVLVNLFFAWRICKLGRNIYIPCVIFVLIAAKLVCITGFVGESEMKGTEAWRIGNKAIAWQIAAISISTACDGIITICTIYYLQKGRSGFFRTNQAINYIITYMVKTCMLTTIFNMLTLIFWVKNRSSLLYSLFYFIVIRLYSCTFLSIINSRLCVRKELDASDEQSRISTPNRYSVLAFTPTPITPRVPRIFDEPYINISTNPTRQKYFDETRSVDSIVTVDISVEASSEESSPTDRELEEGTGMSRMPLIDTVQIPSPVLAISPSLRNGDRTPSLYSTNVFDFETRRTAFDVSRPWRC